MTFQDILPAHQTHGLVQTISRLRGALAHHHQRRKAYHKTLAELSATSDRALADIGIARGDIPYMATQAADMV